MDSNTYIEHLNELFSRKKALEEELRSINRELETEMLGLGFSKVTVDNILGMWETAKFSPIYDFTIEP